LAEFSSPAYVSWAREQIESGRKKAGHSSKHHLTVFAFTCAGSTIGSARKQLRPIIASAIFSGGIDTQLAPLGILPQVHELRKNGGKEHLEASMPDDWIDALAIVGTQEDWHLAIGRLIEAGADSVVLAPLPGKGPDELDVFARYLQ
jgi:alkanesulfonate monooxygenase SsuD/methylene tetrahydromethanopterin reductase-like flavin-dependent oxidoreductase (luciferase family)